MKQLFINLPVTDLHASAKFYSSLGFTINHLFTFDDQKCMVWSEQVYVMLQTYRMFESGNNKKLPDTHQYAITTFTLPVESIEHLNNIVEKGLSAGGKEQVPMRDEGFMQVRTIEDPDGHTWAFICLDIDKFREITGK